MNAESLNLQGYPNGATLYVTFDTTKKVAPFTIYIYSEEGGVQYYKREVNKNKVEINLPRTTPKMTILWDGNFKTKGITIAPLRKPNIPYKFDERIKQKRNYKIEDIQKKILPLLCDTIMTPQGLIEIPTDQPARFAPNHGIMELSGSVLKKFPIYTVEFVVDHEEGHYYYGRPLPPKMILDVLPDREKKHFQEQLIEDEKAADIYALYKMLNKGYNCSGNLLSLTEHLSDNYMSKERMKNLADEIDKLHKKHLI